ncbi:MAG: uracil-DNA glycosylase [Thermoplasmata archaeon]
MTSSGYTLTDCRECRLWTGRANIVNGTGPRGARIVFVGEAPGRDEDLAGEPFVGRAGRILNEALEEAGVDRGAVYITHLVRCRPPENRRPRQDEVSACAGHLRRELASMDPVVVCAMGQTVAHSLFGTKNNMADVTGKEIPLEMGARRFRGIIAYHPAACLYRRANLDSFRSTVRKSLRMAGMV